MNLVNVLYDFGKADKEGRVDMLRDLVNQNNDLRRRLSHCESVDTNANDVPFWTPSQNNVIRVYGNRVFTDDVVTEMYREDIDWKSHIKESLVFGIGKELINHVGVTERKGETGTEYSLELAVMMRKDYIAMVREIQRLMIDHEVSKSLKDKVYKLLSGESKDDC